MGLPFALAHFISGDAPEIVRRYRRHFRPSRTAAPRVILAISALAADTREEAEERAATIDLWRLRIRRGVDLPVPSLEEARAYAYTPYDEAEIASNRQRLVLGTPRTVRAQIEMLTEAHGADEVMVLTIAPDYASRAHSYALLAQAFALSSVAV